MKTVVKEVVKKVVEKKKVFVAEDGKEFDKEWRCREYETDLLRKMAKERNDIEFCDALEGRAPNYSEWDSGDCDKDYYWIKANSKEAVELLNKAYHPIYNDRVFEEGTWMCVEIGYDDDIDLLSEDDIMDSISRQFEELGIKVTFSKEGEK